MSIRARHAVSVLAFVGLTLLAVEPVRGQQIPTWSPTYPTPVPINPMLDRLPVSGYECLHGPGELPEEAARRSVAVAAVRVINTAQMRSKAQARNFLNTAEVLQLPDLVQLREAAQDNEVAPGWHLRLWTATDGYIFTISDTTDPCRFSYFSDDRGLIYTAQPIR